ncbi:hypothetical protein DXG01_013547, partial [Tephrocybe rancida]
PAGGPIIARHIKSLQEQEDDWHADTDNFAVFVANMNCAPDTAANPLFVNAATFTTLVQYRIVDTALFRNKAIPTRKAVLRPGLKERKLPTLGTKLSLRKLDDLPSFISTARNSFNTHISIASSSEPVVTKLDLVLFDSQPERLFTAICRRQTNKRATNIIVNLESVAFHLRYLLDGHPDLPNSKDELLAYFA